MAYRDQPLGELALSIPRASALFRKYDMDYCCGGCLLYTSGTFSVVMTKYEIMKTVLRDIGVSI